MIRVAFGFLILLALAARRGRQRLFALQENAAWLRVQLATSARARAALAGRPEPEWVQPALDEYAALWRRR